MREDLLELLNMGKKSQYRTMSQTKELADADARLFLTALYLNGNGKDSSDHILGGQCYLITNSSLYLRSAKRIGLLDVVTTHPKQLMSLLDLVSGIKITASEFASLFENPLLIYAVSQTWEDVETLLDSGIDLLDKSLSRLKWDIDQELHHRIVALKAADKKAESTGEKSAAAAGDSEYTKLMELAGSRGYKAIPAIDSLIRDLVKVQRDSKAKAEALEQLSSNYEELEKAISHFGKRRQKYLRRMARKSLENKEHK